VIATVNTYVPGNGFQLNSGPVGRFFSSMMPGTGGDVPAAVIDGNAIGANDIRLFYLFTQPSHSHQSISIHHKGIIVQMATCNMLRKL
jgi:hypothetical protein